MLLYEQDSSLFAHPRFEKSKTNRALLKNIEQHQGITFNDLYEQYPDFNIDVDREKERLIGHEVITLASSFLYVQRSRPPQAMD